jgi:hypothetical protein
MRLSMMARAAIPAPAPTIHGKRKTRGAAGIAKRKQHRGTLTR